ncbi:DinB family protein [Rossellomorea aquimaris]|uniref:DinB family protein n=1 Tax=Rossellomorea aquimaris TaxID=189382 RepID=UPI001CD575E4|nr:DinB family protein [Rossellomorea aquimaris]MCA1055019.1 DinB family protein [Rossellomorea aquimaris]
MEFAYHVWATEKLLGHLKTLPGDIFHKEIRSVFPSVERTLFHLYEVDALWFSRLKGEQVPLKKHMFETVGECEIDFSDLHKEILDWLSDMSDELVSVNYTTSNGEAFKNTRREILHHLVNHGTYHRGNIAAMLWQLGERSVSTDYIYYVREQG